MSAQVKPPGQAELETALGEALPIWTGILRHAETAHAPLSLAWRPSKSAFGRMCLLQQGKRTLLYLTPDTQRVWVAIVLGERAFQIAMSSSLPDAIKQLLVEARPHVEGRGIRFPVAALDTLPWVASLLEAKTART